MTVTKAVAAAEATAKAARDVAVMAVVEEKRAGAKVAVVKVVVDQATKERCWGRRGSRERR